MAVWIMSNAYRNMMFKIYDFTSHHEAIIKYSLIIFLIALGIYLRALPAIHYGLELHANDPWIEYWQANYTYYHGLGSWYTLTRANPATHIFWYPWGRDFTLSSYPAQPLWSAATYPLVAPFGLTIKDWVALQPLVFAVVAFIAIYLAAKEIMDGSDLAGISALLLYVLVPSASDRNIVGFVEKEGLALGFVFLAVYFYSKMIKSLEKGSTEKQLTYALLTGLMIAIVGWFWGGYIYVLGSLVGFLVLYPLFEPKKVDMKFIEYNLLVFVSSIIFELPSPKNIANLGFYPKFHISVGVIYIAALTLPVLFYYLHNRPEILHRKKPLLTPAAYLVVLIIISIAGAAAIALGYISLSARYAWALGLRFVKAPPLVQSVEEHQPALVANGVQGVFTSWGTGFLWLFFASPLILAIIGGFYLLYKGRADRIYVALAFFTAFYAYMNATYFEASASAYGLLVAGVFLAYLMEKSVPSRQAVVARKKGRVTLRTRSDYSIIALILVLLVFVNLAQSGVYSYQQHSRMIYSIMAGGAPINARTDAWYETLDFLRHNVSSNALIVAWWDYGYWISVGAHRATVADGATLNSTQISILAKILTATNETEMIQLLRELHAPVNNTYILTFDVFQFRIMDNGTRYIVSPAIPSASGMVGLVDIPKSIWMIRIGGRDISKYFYLYTSKNFALISPRFDQPDNLPVIYKIMVDGIIQLNKIDKNHTYIFQWFTGSTSSLDPRYKRLEDQMGIRYQVTITSYKTITTLNRPKMKYLKPYMVIAEPFEGLAQGNTVLMDVIFIYQVVFPSS
jgi:dolichyl-diphosphooligosaccharide--protein glycosyltransferase